MIAFLSMHPAPYRDPVLNRIQNEFGDKFIVITLYQQTTHKEWGLSDSDYKEIKLKKPIRIFSKIDFHPDLLRVLNQRRYSIIMVQGYLPLTSLFAAIYAKIHHIKLIYCADTATIGKGSIKCRWINKWIARKAYAIWTPGVAGKELWLNMGIPYRHIYEGLYMLDDAGIMVCKNQYEKKQELRKQLNLEQKFVYLFVGNFIPTRNALLLLQSYMFVATSDTALLMIGRGEQYEELCALAMEYNNSNIHIIPGVAFNDLHYYFAIADAYIHPGREPYSLALQEAAFMGIPIVATQEIGAVWDYVVHDKNGIIIDLNNSGQLVDALMHIRNFTVDQSVHQLCLKRNVHFAAEQAIKMILHVQEE